MTSDVNCFIGNVNWSYERMEVIFNISYQNFKNTNVLEQFSNRDWSLSVEGRLIEGIKSSKCAWMYFGHQFQLCRWEKWKFCINNMPNLKHTYSSFLRICLYWYTFTFKTMLLACSRTICHGNCNEDNVNLSTMIIQIFDSRNRQSRKLTITNDSVIIIEFNHSSKIFSCIICCTKHLKKHLIVYYQPKKNVRSRIVGSIKFLINC